VKVIRFTELPSNFALSHGTPFRTARTRSIVMEPILIASYTAMLKAHPDTCSVDRILEDPEQGHAVRMRARS
jgi:hypothetical protein